MLWTTNNVITIKRLVESVWEKTYSQTVASWINVYIEPISDKIGVAMDGQGAFNTFKLFSTYTNIVVWDKITDKNNISYKVNWVKLFTSIVGTDIECLINSEYD